MKIAFVNDIIHAYAAGSSAAVGGAERYQWLLARALARSGFSVTVGVQKGIQEGARYSVDGVEFVGLSHCLPLRAWYNFLASEQPDWWYWQCADHMWGPAVEISKLLGVGTIFSAAVDRDVRPRRALFRRPYCWPLYAWGLLRSDKIFVQHEGQLSQLPYLSRLKASILPGIVGVRPYSTPHAEREKYVAWVAVLRQVKRPDLLIELARSLPQIRFVVCGAPTTFFARPGYGEQMVKELRALPNVEYRGQVASNEAIEIISSAAALISTSDEEGFPSTFLEAWSAGTPVISLHLDPGGIIERFGLGKVSGSIDRAIKDLAALMESAQHRDQIAVRAIQYVASHHSETAAVRAFTQGIQKIATRRNGHPSTHSPRT